MAQCDRCQSRESTSVEKLSDKATALCDECSDDLKLKEQTRHDLMQVMVVLA